MAPMGPPPKKGMSTASIVLIVLLVLLVLGGGGCAICVGVIGSKASDLAEQEKLDKSRARNVNIGTLLSDYKSNEVRADNQYKNKWLLVQGGTVDTVHSSYIMVGTGKSFEIPQVQCILKSDQTGKAAGLSKGRRVNVRGKGGGQILNVIIHDCEIL
jgi:hypothetical protein